MALLRSPDQARLLVQEGLVLACRTRLRVREGLLVRFVLGLPLCNLYKRLTCPLGAWHLKRSGSEWEKPALCWHRSLGAKASG